MMVETTTKSSKILDVYIFLVFNATQNKYCIALNMYEFKFKMLPNKFKNN
jgi:hypothetical protein